MMAALIATMLLTLAPRDSIHVRVLAMTDFHGALESRTYPSTGGRLVGGAAARLYLSLKRLTAFCR